MSDSESTGSPAILFSSAAHSPKSINLQRSLQNGLNCCCVFHITSFLQVGHETIIYFQNTQRVNRNGMSSEIWRGRLLSDDEPIKRIVNLCLPPLISAKQGKECSIDTLSN